MLIDISDFMSPIETNTHNHSALLQDEEVATVGLLLRRAREQKGLSLEEIAASTRITTANLQAIEESAFESLPADAFTRGFVQIYANLLMFDGPELAGQFLREKEKYQMGTPKAKWERNLLTPKKFAEPTRVSSATYALILLVLIVIFLAVLIFYTGWNPFSYVVNRMRSEQTANTQMYHPANPLTRAEIKAMTLEAHFLKDTPVTLKLDDQTSLTAIYAKDTRASWAADKVIYIEFAVPESAELKLNGHPLRFPENDKGPCFLSLRAPRPQSTS